MIRSHVSNSGMLSRMVALVKLLVDALGERTADAFHACKIFDARGEHSLQAAEVLEKLLAPARSDGRNLLQARGGARLAAARAVAGNRETVCLVSDLLDQMGRRVVRGQPARLLLARHEKLLQARFPLFALGHPDHAKAGHSYIRHHPTRRGYLPPGL